MNAIKILAQPEAMNPQVTNEFATSQGKKGKEV